MENIDHEDVIKKTGRLHTAKENRRETYFPAIASASQSARNPVLRRNSSHKQGRFHIFLPSHYPCNLNASIFWVVLSPKICF